MKEMPDKSLIKRLIKKRKIIKNKLDIHTHGEIVEGKMLSTNTKHLQDIENELSSTVNTTRNQPYKLSHN